MKYQDEIRKGTFFLAENPKTVFIGQNVSYPGNAIYTGSLKDIAPEKKIEMPVFEETQMGISIGLALEGFIPISIFPRYNFLIVAANQLVNHLDKISRMSGGKVHPKVIIKTMVGSVRPLNAGVQHSSDFTAAFKNLLTDVVVEDLTEPEMIFPAYKQALEREDGRSTLLVEYGDYYNEK